MEDLKLNRYVFLNTTVFCYVWIMSSKRAIFCLQCWYDLISSRQRATKITRVFTLAQVKWYGGDGSKLAEENREKFNDFNFVTKSQIFSFVQPPLRAAALDIVLQADRSISVCRLPGNKHLARGGRNIWSWHDLP